MDSSNSKNNLTSSATTICSGRTQVRKNDGHYTSDCNKMLSGRTGGQQPEDKNQCLALYGIGNNGEPHACKWNSDKNALGGAKGCEQGSLCDDTNWVCKADGEGNKQTLSCKIEFTNNGEAGTTKEDCQQSCKPTITCATFVGCPEGESIVQNPSTVDCPSSGCTSKNCCISDTKTCASFQGDCPKDEIKLKSNTPCEKCDSSDCCKKPSGTCSSYSGTCDPATQQRLGDDYPCTDCNSGDCCAPNKQAGTCATFNESCPTNYSKKDPTVHCDKCDDSDCCDVNTCFNYDCPDGYSLNSSNPCPNGCSQSVCCTKNEDSTDYTIYIVGVIIFVLFMLFIFSMKS